MAKSRGNDPYYARFFNPQKSNANWNYKPFKGTLVWNSQVKGTYVRKLHGELE